MEHIAQDGDQVHVPADALLQGPSKDLQEFREPAVHAVFSDRPEGHMGM
jgi:hypothetical protein